MELAATLIFTTQTVSFKASGEPRLRIAHLVHRCRANVHWTTYWKSSPSISLFQLLTHIDRTLFESIQSQICLEPWKQGWVPGHGLISRDPPISPSGPYFRRFYIYAPTSQKIPILSPLRVLLLPTTSRFKAVWFFFYTTLLAEPGKVKVHGIRITSQRLLPASVR